MFLQQLRASGSLLICATFLMAVPTSSLAEEIAAFPLTVEHKLAETTIADDPQRIVTLGWSGEDAVLALGKTPVAMTKYGAFADGMFPWVKEKISGNPPVLLSGDLDYEQIAALKPDLIVGVYSGIDDRAYARLSSIAPTVVYRSAPWSADWREQMTVIGEALGKSDDASALIAETNDMLRALGNAHPELKGKSFTFGTYFPGNNSVVVYLPRDPRVEALMELGMVPSQGISDLAKTAPKETSVSVSLENLASVDADILIMWYGEGARAAAEAQPLFHTLGSVKSGAYVALEDPVDVWSTSALSVLSIPYGFPRFVPRLAEAATRVGR